MRATLSDYRRLASQAIVNSATDYYPFGMVARSWSSSQQYRYAFNGKEIDTEGVGGNGITYDFGFRIYNPNIARFLSVDPLSPKYPWYTPYQFAGNNPIKFIDLDGLEEVDPQKKTAALNKINEFKNDKTATDKVWEQISKEDFIAALTEIVNDPTKLNQANTNLCGVTTACKMIATFDPESLVMFQIICFVNILV